jgi:hypothetical protein
MSVEVMTKLFTLSCRLNATYRPPMRRGKMAIPLFWAACPVSVEIRNPLKSAVSMSCGSI